MLLQHSTEVKHEMGTLPYDSQNSEPLSQRRVVIHQERIVLHICQMEHGRVERTEIPQRRQLAGRFLYTTKRSTQAAAQDQLSRVPK